MANQYEVLGKAPVAEDLQKSGVESSQDYTIIAIIIGVIAAIIIGVIVKVKKN